MTDLAKLGCLAASRTAVLRDCAKKRRDMVAICGAVVQAPDRNGPNFPIENGLQSKIEL